jgi:hypothetical protein
VSLLLDDDEGYGGFELVGYAAVVVFTLALAVLFLALAVLMPLVGLYGAWQGVRWHRGHQLSENQRVAAFLAVPIAGLAVLWALPG